MNELLTTNEVAAMCRVTPYTVRRWVTEGRLRAVTLGQLRYHRADVDQLINPPALACEQCTKPVDNDRATASLRLGLKVLCRECDPPHKHE